MTDLLRRAVAKVQSLPPEQQDLLAEVLLEEMASERRWQKLLARPIEGTTFEAMLREAEQEIESGRAEPLDALLNENESGKITSPDKGRAR